MEKIIQRNRPFSLKVRVGSSSIDHPGSYSSDLIGSDIEPKELGSISDPDTGKGTVFRKTWTLIVQDRTPFVIEEIREDSYYELAWRDGWEDWQVLELPAVKI